MTRRQVIAALALGGVLDSTYLLLHRLGIIGELACINPGSCDIVNASVYASIKGMPVAAVGLVGYVLILAVALASVQPGWAENSRFDQLLAVLSGGGAAFSVYLTFVSITILHATCQWCLVSLALILGIFALSVWALVAVGGASVDGRQ